MAEVEWIVGQTNHSSLNLVLSEVLLQSQGIKGAEITGCLKSMSQGQGGQELSRSQFNTMGFLVSIPS